MASRIFWVLLAGVALVTGMVMQDGGRMFGWAHEQGITRSTEQAIDAQVDRAIVRAVNEAKVVDEAGEVRKLSADAKQALGAAVSELVRAETDLALAKVRDADAAEMKAATERRDEARATVDRLKEQIKAEDNLASAASGETSAQVQQQVRDEVRDAIRDTVRN